MWVALCVLQCKEHQGDGHPGCHGQHRHTGQGLQAGDAQRIRDKERRQASKQGRPCRLGLGMEHTTKATTWR